VVNPPKEIAANVVVRELEMEDSFVTARAAVSADGQACVVQFQTTWRLLEDLSGLGKEDLAEGLLLLDDTDCRNHLAEGLRTAFGLWSLDRFWANGAGGVGE